MTSYDMVRGFAPMIREVVRTKRMPPWHADPHYGSSSAIGHFGRRSAKMLVHWVEAGAPRGMGPDPLARRTTTWSEWSLGKPDLIVEVPAFEVPATGVVSYQYPRRDQSVGTRRLDTCDRNHSRRPFGRAPRAGRDRRSRQRRAARDQRPDRGTGRLRAGQERTPYPADTGILLRKEASFRFQMHYTPNGKAITDVTRVGYYSTTSPQSTRCEMAMILDTSLAIPANAKSHSQSLEQVFDRDVMLVQPDAARAPARPRREIHRTLSGRARGDPAVGAEIRLQLADRLCLDPSKLLPAGTASCST